MIKNDLEVQAIEMPFNLDQYYIFDQFIASCIQIPRGLTARIAGFHPAGPGSTPGVGIKPFYHLPAYITIQLLFNLFLYLILLKISLSQNCNYSKSIL